MSASPEISTREREVLNLIAQGMRDREICDRLGIAPDTVLHHVQTIREKLGAVNRAHAVAIGVSRGLVEVPA